MHVRRVREEPRRERREEPLLKGREGEVAWGGVGRGCGEMGEGDEGDGCSLTLKNRWP